MSKNWPGLNSAEKGKMAEERFFEACKDISKMPKWVVAVVRATKEEDLFEKTDALIMAQRGKPYKIQIKSYFLDEEGRRELIEYGVVPLYIFAKDTLQDIRRKTIIAIMTYNEFWNDKNKSQKSKPEKTTSSFYYYKRGSKKPRKIKTR